MKGNTIAVILLALVSSYTIYRAMGSMSGNSLSKLSEFSQEDIKLFLEFKEKYNKVYENPEEMIFRLRTLLRNKARID